MKSLLLTSLLVFLPMGTVAQADDNTEERRINIGASIFPRLVAVDSKLEQKLTAAKKVKLIIIYANDKTKAKSISQLIMEKVKNIAKSVC